MLWRAQTQVPPRLCAFVPSQWIGPLGGVEDVHLIGDASLGYVWKMAVPPLEGIDDGEIAAEHAYDALLRTLSDGATLELFVERGTDVSPYLATYAAQVRPQASGSIAQEICLRLHERWRSAESSGFFPERPTLNFWPRTQSIYLFFKSAPSKLWLGSDFRFLMAAAGGSLRRLVDTELATLAARFRQQIRQIEQTAAEYSLRLRPLGAGEYVNWAGRLLFPQRRGVPAVDFDASGLESPGEAIAQMGDFPLIERGRFVTEWRGRAIWHMAVSMAWQGTVGPGMLAGITDHEHDVTVCLSYRAAARVQTLISLKAQQHINRKSSLPFNEVEVEEKDESLTEAQRRMFSGETAGAVRLIVWVRGPSESDAEDKAHRVLSVLDRYMPAEVERRIGSSLLFSSLPGARNPVAEGAQARTRRMMSGDAASLAPLGGYWEGTDPDRSLALYATRWGTPLFLDPRVCERNPHFLVVGGSGSGKSFWVHDYLIQLYRLADVWSCLVSIKPDYERLARLLGQYVELDLDGSHSISPFRGPPTHDNCAMWVAVLSLILSDGKERFAIDKDAEAVLTESAMTAARINWDARRGRPIQETQLSHIAHRLELSALGRELVARMQPYLTGPYSRLFNRPNSLNMDGRFVFFNLSRVVNYTCAAAASMCIFSYVNSVMVDPARLAQQKVLGLDEGWALMRGQGSAELVEKAFRAYRSYNGMAFAVSQLLSDFDTPVGKAVLANTATKFILPQEQSSLAELPRYLELGAKERALVASLELRKGCFGEFLVKMQGYPSTVGRVIPDPLRYAISTTDGTDSARFNELLASCGDDYAGAVRQFADRLPYGKPSARSTHEST
jgi:hypothetical protein